MEKPTTNRDYSALLLKLSVAYERANSDRDFAKLVELERMLHRACEWQWEFGIWPTPRIVQGRNHVAKMRKTGVVYNV